jgi:hypothetical protein
MGTLTGIESGAGIENLYYIRCKDISNNPMGDAYQFRLMGSDMLNIISLEPDNGTYYYPNFVLTVITSGGADNGNAVCKYQEGSFPNVDFFTTGGTVHTQPQNRTTGDYYYNVTCDDSAGNNAQGQMHIIIDTDDDAPVIQNIYSQGGVLNVITDEPSTCEYSTDDPYFTQGQGSQMVGVMVTQHSLSFVDNVYYILCYDAFGNTGNTITVYNTG